MVFLADTYTRYVNSLLFPTQLYGPQGKSLCLIYHLILTNTGTLEEFKNSIEWVNEFSGMGGGEKA